MHTIPRLARTRDRRSFATTAATIIDPPFFTPANLLILIYPHSLTLYWPPSLTASLLTYIRSLPPVSTAGRLKYADPKDLPSFPSAGLSQNAAAASAAATLGWANQKSPEPWRPDKTSSASAAAVLAKDYKSSATWEPASDSGASKAALLAVGSAGAALKPRPETPKKSAHDNWGNSAATQAFHATRPASAEASSVAGGGTAATQAFHSNRASTIEHTAQSSPSKSIEQRSLAAAKGAMASSKSDSARPSSAKKDNYALEASAASSALNGATLAHRNSLMVHKPTIEEVGAVPITNMTRNMFTSHPPVKPETDEERIHQTAVEMAKKMYQHQQKKLDQNKGAEKEQENTPFAGTYLNLQDAAYKQAQERLAKLHDEHQQNRDAQEYYGNSSSPRRKFSMANKLRRRADSDPVPDDKVQSEKIRQQMSMFSNKLSQVDTEKRAKDREALLAAAQRNVKARLQGMDEKVYNETGKRSSNKLSDWEMKAQQAAQARSDTRTENKGKIDIGGGKFMTQEEINAIAAKRLQPVLDDINEKAEIERARIATLKAEEDARREELERIKAEERAEKEEAKKAKEQEKAEEKAKRAEEKQEAKAKKDEEKLEAKAKKDEEKTKKAHEKEELKARKEQEKTEKAEQQRLAKEEKRKSKLGGAAATAPTTAGETEAAPETHPSHEAHPAAAEEDDDSDDLLDTDDEHDRHRSSAAESTPSHGVETTDTATPRKSVEGSASSQKSKPGVKGWLKKRFSVSHSKHDEATAAATVTTTKKDSSEKRRSFFGGSSKAKAHDPVTSLENRSSSMRDVALAGKDEVASSTAKKSEDVDKAPALEIKEPEAKLATSSATAAAHEPVVTHHKPATAKDKADSRGVSPISSPVEEHAAPVDAHPHTDTLALPKPIEDDRRRSSSSLARDSRFIEEM
ncbi:hypothetical protein ISF_04095 [Cordyceps fumosorosea ARSEF 2679]|uniref:Eisosome protein 1 n=1 Tax=Cordyceps fumosorosea (strain ARSEF 2679) TaxID=1081104 RepID=A0A167YF88_CORFA|nr:hypothetical protein ISF_04095 [Cordyceps fumosorosea ARSEF 2679]OAA66257.1 hypothetical protein ISF_04095 [Cordyceps fumosorosea ARSEF 2679]